MVRRVKLHYQFVCRPLELVQSSPVTLGMGNLRSGSDSQQLYERACASIETVENSLRRFGQAYALTMDAKGIQRASGSRCFLNALGALPIQPEQ